MNNYIKSVAEKNNANFPKVKAINGAIGDL